MDHFEDLIIEEHLSLTANIYQAPSSRVRQLLRVLNLEGRRDTFARQCSDGMRKKTSFAMALLPTIGFGLIRGGRLIIQARPTCRQAGLRGCIFDLVESPGSEKLNWLCS